MRLANKGVVGWGYCGGDNWERDLANIEQVKNDLSLSAFVADIEPGNDPGDGNIDEWDADNFDKFIKELNKLFGRDNLAISTWSVLELKGDYNAPAVQDHRVPAAA